MNGVRILLKTTEAIALKSFLEKMPQTETVKIAIEKMSKKPKSGANLPKLLWLKKIEAAQLAKEIYDNKSIEVPKELHKIITFL